MNQKTNSEFFRESGKKGEIKPLPCQYFFEVGPGWLEPNRDHKTEI